MIALYGILFAAMTVSGLPQCPKTKIVNTSGYKWNNFDATTLNISKRRCGELYSQSPCVKTFTKWGERDYRVICGKGGL